MEPLISIITPCYNSERYITRYLDSMLSQTYKNIQLILVNDGSIDSTEEKIYLYKEKLESENISFTYVSQENQGLGAAINTGLKLIKGEYFTWCDSDNFYDDEYLEKCVQYINVHPECNILRCDAYTVMEDNLKKPIQRFSKGNTEKYKKKLFDNAIFEKNFHFGCALLKTSAFDKVNPKREIYKSREGQNWQLLLPMFHSYEASYIDEPLFYFVYRRDSISNITSQQSIEKKFEQCDEYEKILNESLKGLDIDIKLYQELIKIKYLKRKFNLAIRNSYKGYIEKFYSEMKELECLNYKDHLKYHIGIHVNKSIFNLFKKMYQILRGIKRKLAFK